MFHVNDVHSIKISGETALSYQKMPIESVILIRLLAAELLASENPDSCSCTSDVVAL